MLAQFYSVCEGSHLARARSSVTSLQLAEPRARDCCDWYNGQVEPFVWADEGTKVFK